MMSLLPFWPLNMVVPLLYMQGQKALRFHQKYLNLCSKDERRSYRFGTTWGWAINLNFWVNYPIKQCCGNMLFRYWFVLHSKQHFYTSHLVPQKHKCTALSLCVRVSMPCVCSPPPPALCLSLKFGCQSDLPSGYVHWLKNPRDKET